MKILKVLDYETSKNKNLRADATRAIRKVIKGMRIYLPKYINVISMPSASDKYVGPIEGSTAMGIIDAPSIKLTTEELS